MSLDSDDVVERLRTWTALGMSVPFIRDLNDAIAEIERLRAALAEIREIHQPTWTSELSKIRGKAPWACIVCGVEDGSWPCSTRLTIDESRD